MLDNKYDNIKIPERLDEVVQKGLADGIIIRKESSYRKRALRCGGTATGVAMTFFILAANPALAAKVPVVGDVFKQVENQITFSGNYSSTLKPVNQVISASDKGIKLEVKEAACDSSSVYLTFNVQSEESLGQIQKFFTTGSGERKSAFMYINGEWSIGKNGEKHYLNNVRIEGDQIDEHNFVGMAKINVSEFKGLSDSLDFCLSLDHVGADQVLDKEANHSPMPSYYKSGAWNLSIPVKVDNSKVKTVEMNEISKDGYGIKSVTVTPFELRVNTTEKTAREDYGVAVYTQDGTRLEFEEQEGNSIIYSIQNKNVTSIELFVCKGAIDTVKCKDKNMLQSNAVVHKTIDFKN